jgi:hypothetical protein
MQGQLSDFLWAGFQVGDSLQRQAIDLLFDLASLRAPVERVRRLNLELVEQVGETAATLAPGEDFVLALTQFQSNLEVFALVKRIGQVLAIPPGPHRELRPLVRAAYTLGPYRALWAIEGLGQEYADRLWNAGEPLVGILQDARTGGVPSSSLTMLHAGIGLAFAKRLLVQATPFDPGLRLKSLVRRFRDLCTENCWPGYQGAALESLGLVARTWHPQLVARLDDALGELDPVARDYFWHGAGRALYFHPLHIVPGVLSPWRAVEREAPDTLAQLNMKAGLAWATVLVNSRQPRILERLIERSAATLRTDGAFANGVLSALTVALDIDVDNPNVTRLREYPARLDGASWTALVLRPSLDAADVRRVLARRRRLGEVFRYHRYPEWFARSREGDEGRGSAVPYAARPSAAGGPAWIH